MFLVSGTKTNVKIAPKTKAPAWHRKRPPIPWKSKGLDFFLVQILIGWYYEKRCEVWEGLQLDHHHLGEEVEMG